MDEAAALMFGLSKERALKTLWILASQLRGGRRLLLRVADYSAPNVADNVVRIILSYTAYVNRVVWKTY